MTNSLLSAPVTSQWFQLAPLPDPVGFAGMVAGVSQGKLLAGGGSRFVEKPVWDGGTKSFDDRMFCLASPKGEWQVLPEKLPTRVAHGAVTSYKDSLLLAGGMNETGCLKAAYRIGFQGDKLAITSLPDLPHPLGYAAGEVVGDYFYLAGGVEGPSMTSPLKECWRLKLDGGTAWERLPDLPGRAPFAPAAATDGKNFYLFGGMHYVEKEGEKPLPVPLDSAWMFDPAKNAWAELPPIPLARVAPVSPATQTPSGEIFLVGGYAKVFPGELRLHPGFDIETFFFNPKTEAWREGPEIPAKREINPSSTTNPGPEAPVATPAVIWNGFLVIIGGEVRAATRTPCVLAIPLKDLE